MHLVCLNAILKENDFICPMNWVTVCCILGYQHGLDRTKRGCLFILGMVHWCPIYPLELYSFDDTNPFCFHLKHGITKKNSMVIYVNKCTIDGLICLTDLVRGIYMNYEASY